MADVPAKLRDNQLWKEVYSLAGLIYAKLDDLVANFPDEKWNSASRLRNAANDSLFYVSLAVGSATPETSLHDWNSARRNLFALQSVYTFAAKQKFFELEPEVIVTIDRLLKVVDKEMDASRLAAERREQKELEPWLEKYRLWQTIQK